MAVQITVEELERLSETLSDQEIGVMYGVSYTRIWELRKKAGVRSFREKSGGLKKNPRTGEVTYGGKNTIQFNERFFQNIDQEDKAYFLGFLAADGHVRKSNHCCQLSIQKRDEALMYRFANSLELNPAHIKTRIHKGKFEMSEVYLSSRFMCEDLKAIGLGHDKSFTLQINSDKLPEDMVRHFIRGYSDGNGTFHRESDLRICTCSKDFAFQLMHWLTFPGSKPAMQIHNTNRKNTLYIVRLGRRNGKAGLLWLYENQTICLERKFSQFSRFYL